MLSLDLPSQKPPPAYGMKRERSSSLESSMTEQMLAQSEPSAVAVAEMLFSLKSGKRDRSSSSAGSSRGQHDDDEQPLQLREERSLSSSGSACSAPGKATCNALTATSTPKQIAPLATRSYVWRGPKRSLLNPGLTGACPGQVTSSDAEDDDEIGGAVLGQPIPMSATELAAAHVSSSGGERSDREKEWAALTTWLRMNLHHPRTAKREVLFVGKHVEGRGWQFFLNPALSWNDVSPETKMRLRTLPHETEMAFNRKYPGKPARDWVKKTQKYRPPGCSVTYSVPLAEMVYSLTGIYYRYEGRPGTGASALVAHRDVAAAVAAAAATAAAGAPAPAVSAGRALRPGPSRRAD